MRSPNPKGAIWSTSLKQFLESQKSYQELNRNIAELTSQRLLLRGQGNRIEQQLAEQRRPAEREYQEQRRAIGFGWPSISLLILVPVLLVAAFLLIRIRGSIYYPVFLAVGGATLLKVASVVHEYFPSRYFKYILILRPIGSCGPLARLSDPDRRLSQRRVAPAAISGSL